MNLQDNYMDILNNIEGLLVVDHEEKVVFMCQELIEGIGFSSLADVAGKNVRELLIHNETYKVLQRGEKISANIYLAEGYILTCNNIPIFKEGKLAGALEYDVFKYAGQTSKIYTGR